VVPAFLQARAAQQSNPATNAPKPSSIAQTGSNPSTMILLGVAVVGLILILRK